MMVTVGLYLFSSLLYLSFFRNYEKEILVPKRAAEVAAEAVENADRVGVMYAGRVAESALVKELFSRPAHPYSKGLLRSIPRLESPPRTLLDTIAGAVPAIDRDAEGGLHRVDDVHTLRDLANTTCLPSGSRASARPTTARLSDSVPPPVNRIWAARLPSSSASLAKVGYISVVS